MRTKNPVRQEYEYATTGKIAGMANGGSMKGLQENPLTAARRANGVPGFKSGGSKMGNTAFERDGDEVTTKIIGSEKAKGFKKEKDKDSYDRAATPKGFGDAEGTPQGFKKGGKVEHHGKVEHEHHGEVHHKHMKKGGMALGGSAGAHGKPNAEKSAAPGTSRGEGHKFREEEGYDGEARTPGVASPKAFAKEEGYKKGGQVKHHGKVEHEHTGTVKHKHMKEGGGYSGEKGEGHIGKTPPAELSKFGGTEHGYKKGGKVEHHGKVEHKHTGKVKHFAEGGLYKHPTGSFGGLTRDSKTRRGS